MDENGITYSEDALRKASLRTKINFWFYWHFKRRAGKIGRWFIWKMPKRVVYWCIIRAAVEVEPNGNPSGVTAEEMLKKFDYN